MEGVGERSFVVRVGKPFEDVRLTESVPRLIV
jgi:hypothetical protein